jgi:hypothetical protein
VFSGPGDLSRNDNTKMLPEEQELARLQHEQAELKEQVSAAELTLQTVKAETAQFQRRYYQSVGRLYAELDALNAQIANLRAKQAPNDATLKARAKAAEQQAKSSAEEAGVIEAQPKLSADITPSLKQAYRRAVKLMHPDLAVAEHERRRRTALMAQINLAYERGDQKTIEKLIEEFGQDPEAISGDDIGSRIVRTIRLIAQLRRRLADVRLEIEADEKTELFQLRRTIEEAEAEGNDPLGDLARQLAQEISEREAMVQSLQRARQCGVHD